MASYGADQANYIVSKSKNRARIIMVTDPEFTTLYYTDQGFEKVIAKSGGSKIVSKLELTIDDFVGNQLVAKIQAELLRHPEATWIRSPYTVRDHARHRARARLANGQARRDGR